MLFIVKREFILPKVSYTKQITIHKIIFLNIITAEKITEIIDNFTYNNNGEISLMYCLLFVWVITYKLTASDVFKIYLLSKFQNTFLLL